MAVKKTRIQFVCQSCGHSTAKWLGRCPSCQTWSSLVEETLDPADNWRQAHSGVSSGDTAAVRLADIKSDDTFRITSGIKELDRVLGGGIVRGSMVLVGGDPGIGKSTLLLQSFAALAKAGERVLYMTGEESVRQIKLRAERLGVADDADELFLLAETRLEALLRAYETLKPKILVIDSIQTIGSSSLDSAHGSVGQIRHVTARLMQLAKQDDVATFVVGHVTKEGTIAGPKVMEHMVDTVLYFEGERTGPFRILRAHKNRFGSAQEIGVFEMGPRGLEPVSNPSELFLSQRAMGPGAVVVTSLEGTRPLLLEVQALVTPSFAQGNPRRSSTGFDPQRTAMLCAVLAARTPIDFTQADVFVNVAGGVRISEPAADLGVILALASAARGRAIDPGWVVIGEVGLAGEVRAAAHLGNRLGEAAALGFGRALVPLVDQERLKEPAPLALTGLATLEQALVACGLWQAAEQGRDRRNA